MKNNYLIDFKKLNPENIVELKSLEDNTIPLDLASELMQMEFNGKTPILVVSVKKILEVEGIELDKVYFNIMNMATNMNLCLDFDFNDCSLDSLKFFVDKFFKGNRVIKYVPSVIELVGDLILFNSNNSSKEKYFLEITQMEELNKVFEEDIKKCSDFLNSMPLFILTTLNGFLEHNSGVIGVEDLSIDDKNDELLKVFEKSGLEIINDIDFLPRNIVCLFYNFNFLVVYYSNAKLDFKNCKYYHQQFNSYMFGGLNLFFHFSNENNIIFHTLNSLDSEGKNLNLFNLLENIQNTK